MRTNIVRVAVLLGMMGIAAEAAAVNGSPAVVMQDLPLLPTQFPSEGFGEAWVSKAKLFTLTMSPNSNVRFTKIFDQLWLHR